MSLPFYLVVEKCGREGTVEVWSRKASGKINYFKRGVGRSVISQKFEGPL